MTNKNEKTIVVLRVPGRPLICLRACDLPVPLESGQVFDFDGLLVQQTHKPIVCVARSSKGTISDANALLRGLISRLYGEAGLTDMLARGALNYSAVSCTNNQVAGGGIRIGVQKLLADGGEDLVFVDCRIVNEQFLREAMGENVRGGIPPITLGLLASPDEASAKPTRTRAARKKRSKDD